LAGNRTAKEGQHDEGKAHAQGAAQQMQTGFGFHVFWGVEGEIVSLDEELVGGS
jgi:hypothetical protein